MYKMDFKVTGILLVNICCLLCAHAKPYTDGGGSNLKLPPKIKYQTTSYNDSTTSIQCIAEDDSEIRWFREDGDELGIQDATLQLPDKTSTYYCLVTNKWGKARSDNIPYKPDFCKQENPQAHLDEPISKRIAPGDDVILTCDHLECSREPLVEWFFINEEEDEEEPVELGANVIQSSDGRLYLKHPTQSLTYQCKAKNYIQDIHVRGTKFKVIIDESITAQPPTNQVPTCNDSTAENRILIKGEALTLDCLCQGKLWWEYDNEVINGHKINVGEILKRKHSSSAYQFLCKNEDTILKNVTVQLEESPENENIQEMEDKLEIPRTEVAEFSCGSGTQFITTWFYNGLKIVEIPGGMKGMKYGLHQNQKTLTLSNFSKGDDSSYPSGVVQCNISNAYGHVWLSARLTVTGTTSVDEVKEETTKFSSPSTTQTSPTSSTTENVIPTRTPNRITSDTTTLDASAIVPDPEASPRRGGTTVPMMQSTTPFGREYVLTTLQIIAIAVIPVFCLTAGICIAVCIFKMAWCGSGRNKQIPTNRQYAPSNQSDAQSMSRFPTRINDVVEIHEVRGLLGNRTYRNPPSAPHSDSGLPDSDNNSIAKHQMLARYLCDSSRYAERHRESNAPSVASSQRYGPSYPITHLPHVPSVAHSCPPSVEQNYHRVQTTV